MGGIIGSKRGVLPGNAAGKVGTGISIDLGTKTQPPRVGRGTADRPGNLAPPAPYIRRAAGGGIGSGLIHHPHAAAGGRTDTLPYTVPSNSFVIPADVVSGLGEGDTYSGARVIAQMLNGSPFGSDPEQWASGNSIPGAPHWESKSQFDPDKFDSYMEMGKKLKGAFNKRPDPNGSYSPPGPSGGGPGTGGGGGFFDFLSSLWPFAKGGQVPGREKVPVIVANGEYLIKPADIKRLGGGDLERGHAILQSLVRQVRARTIKTLKKLPKPVK